MGFHSYGPDDARREKKGKIRRGEFKLAPSFFAPALAAASAGGLRARAVYGMEDLLFFFDALRLAEWRAVWRLSAI